MSCLVVRVRMLWLRSERSAKRVFVVESNKKIRSLALVRFGIDCSAQRNIRQVRCLPDRGCAHKQMINSAPSFFRWLPQQCNLPAELKITGTTGNLVSNDVPPHSQFVVGIVAVAVVTGTCNRRCAYLRFIQRYLTLSLTWPQIGRLGINFGYLQTPQITCRKKKYLSYLGWVSSHVPVQSRTASGLRCQIIVLVVTQTTNKNDKS